MNSKANCITDIAISVRRTANWRRNTCRQRFPDSRNIPAADRLDQLATEANDMTDETWAKLFPYYSWSSQVWSDAVSEASRAVEFRGVHTFLDFVDCLVGILRRASH
jgi:hypothetical protein